MKKTLRLILFVFTFAAILLTACGPRAGSKPAAPTQAYTEEMPAMEPTAGMMDAMPAEQSGITNEKASDTEAGAPSISAPASTQAAPGTGEGSTLPDTQVQTRHMIIKNADIKLQVESTDTALDRATQIISDLGGYIISSRVWYQDYSGTNYKYATVSMGIPVDEFENAMRRLRGLAVRVLDENASGQDVTSEFVDAKSQLGNLEATRDRIRSFLANATTVEESLRINEELSTIEAQIDQVKGRMNYLSGRSSYSTITLTIEPNLPVLTPTPTPTRKPTATPTVWSPGNTVNSARETVTSAYQGIIEVLINFFIIVVPIVAPPVLIIWAIWKFLTRKKKA